MNVRGWICSQYGGRERFAIPRALNARQKLTVLHTDLWIPPRSVFGKLFDRSKGRYHDELANAKVVSYNKYFLFRKLTHRVMQNNVEADSVYDKFVAKSIDAMRSMDEQVVFGYSYSSPATMRTAKRLGHRAFLGQINPGPAEADIVVNEFKKYKSGRYAPTVPNNCYWDRWLEEINYADRIIVNSPWSKRLLVEKGIQESKCSVVPVAYEPVRSTTAEKKFKMNFDKTAPLTLLYLGGIGLRKGFHLLIEAMHLLRTEPVRLIVVGNLKGPKELLANLPPSVTYYGATAPHEVGRYYEMADVFMFPTLSDGFGLTQLEAQAFKVPIISTDRCAPVVEHKRNGIILREITASCIRDAVIEILSVPSILAKFSENSISLKDYSIETLGDRLLSLD